MDRRAFISGATLGLLAASLAAGALVAQAQQQTVRIYRAGLLASFDPEAYVGDFREALRDTGYVEGQDLRLEVRWSDRYERLPGLAAELVTFRPDVLVAWTPPAALAARNATRTIPIVFSFVNEAVALNLVASLARPGGNITGLSNIVIELTPKVLELVKKVRPTASRVQVLWNPVNPGHPLGVQLSHDAAEALQMSALPAEVRGSSPAQRKRILRGGWVGCQVAPSGGCRFSEGAWAVVGGPARAPGGPGRRASADGRSWRAMREAHPPDGGRPGGRGSAP